MRRTGLSSLLVAVAVFALSAASVTQVVLAPGTSASNVRVFAGSRNVTSKFAVRANGKFEGLLTGLRQGANVITARLPDGYGARLTITNHPIGGPVFSGPQIQPWLCQTGASDKQCDQAPTFSYYYLPAGPSAGGSCTAGECASSFVPYDPSNPPPAPAIATTTTTDGVTVPFRRRATSTAISTPSRRCGSPGSPGSRGRRRPSTTGAW